MTTALTARQVRGLRDAVDRADELAVPLNRMTTVHWGALGIADAEAAKATRRLIKLASDWCATKGVKMS